MRFKKGNKVEAMNKEVPSSLYDGYQGVEKVSRKFIRPANHTLKMGIQEDNNDVRLQKSNHVVSRNRKRSSPFHSSVHESSQKVKKVKPAEIHKKVDAFVGNKYIQASTNTSLENGCCYYEMEKRKTTNGVSRISEQEANDEYDDDDSDQCSVGSCSVVVPSGTADSDDVASFVDTSSDDDDDDADDVAVSIHIHRLELHAYRSTLEALYASGPLSWEKEALLTNLRINLHISNDEHLTELRHLISSGVN